MAAVPYAELPHFDRFNQVAGDDTLFDEMVGSDFAELPTDDVFMVAHQMLRDTPYGPRPFYELTYVVEGHAVARICKKEVHLLEDAIEVAVAPVPHCGRHVMRRKVGGKQQLTTDASSTGPSVRCSKSTRTQDTPQTWL